MVLVILLAPAGLVGTARMALAGRRARRQWPAPRHRRSLRRRPARHRRLPRPPHDCHRTTDHGRSTTPARPGSGTTTPKGRHDEGTTAGPRGRPARGHLVLAGCGAGGDRESDSGGGDGGAADIGVTEDTITIGAHIPLTGVAAPGYSEIPTGAQAYFDYVNANGGVNGREIEYIVKDDAYNPTNTSQVTNELVLQDEIFAMVGGLGTPTHSAVVDFLNSEGVPDLFVSSGSLQWGDDVEAKPYTFGWQPDYEIEGKIIGQYIAENMPDAKVGLFLQDDDFGEDGEKGVRQYLDDQIVAVQRYTSGNTDVGPQVAGLQADGADLVLGLQHPVLHRADPAGRAAAGLPADLVLLQRRLRPDAGRLPARAGSPRARSRATALPQRGAHHRVHPRRRRRRRPVGPAVPEGLGRGRRGRRAHQLPHLRHVAGLRLRPGAAGRRRGPDPRRAGGGRGEHRATSRARSWRPTATPRTATWASPACGSSSCRAARPRS